MRGHAANRYCCNKHTCQFVMGWGVAVTFEKCKVTRSFESFITEFSLLIWPAPYRTVDDLLRRVGWKEEERRRSVAPPALEHPLAPAPAMVGLRCQSEAMGLWTAHPCTSNGFSCTSAHVRKARVRLFTSSIFTSSSPGLTHPPCPGD